MLHPKWRLQYNIYHQPVVHANFTQATSNRVDVFFIDPRFEQFHSEGGRDTCNKTQTTSQLQLHSENAAASLERLNRSAITFLDQVLIIEAVQDGGWYIAIGQQDSGKHGQFIPLWLCEPF